MDESKFEIEIFALHDYFQRNRPPLRTISLWFLSIKHIPNEAAKWVREWIQRESDSLPRNISKTFNAGWYQWQAGHLDRMTAPVREDCLDCEGRGHLTYKAPHPHPDVETLYELNCRCRSCSNWKIDWPLKSKTPAYTRAQLEEKYEVWPYKEMKEAGKRFRARRGISIKEDMTVKEMAKEVGLPYQDEVPF